MAGEMGGSLKRVETSLPGVYEICPQVFADARGFFLESYHRRKFAEIGITDDFVQDNHSSSKKGTLRGLHYQLHYPQAKLCRVVEGEALDVAVDIRLGSLHFGKWTSVMLSGQKQNQVYIPAGFAHGFLALSDTVLFLYKCSDYYHHEDERGISWSDPALEISWGIKDPFLSSRDSAFSGLANIPPDALPRY
jgi:dTDP-4-dehydrorhamnose 3,5-epimerase